MQVCSNCPDLVKNSTRFGLASTLAPRVQPSGKPLAAIAATVAESIRGDSRRVTPSPHLHMSHSVPSAAGVASAARFLRGACLPLPRRTPRAPHHPVGTEQRAGREGDVD